MKNIEGITPACMPFGFERFADRIYQIEKFITEMQAPISNEYREEFINGKLYAPFLDVAINRKFI